TLWQRECPNEREASIARDRQRPETTAGREECFSGRHEAENTPFSLRFLLSRDLFLNGPFCPDVSQDRPSRQIAQESKAFSRFQRTEGGFDQDAAMRRRETGNRSGCRGNGETQERKAEGSGPQGLIPENIRPVSGNGWPHRGRRE